MPRQPRKRGVKGSCGSDNKRKHGKHKVGIYPMQHINTFH